MAGVQYREGNWRVTERADWLGVGWHGGRWIASCLALTIGFAGSAGAQSQCDATSPRNELRIFQYVVKTDEEASRFLKFHQILFENLLELSREASVEGLKVSPSPSRKPPKAPDSLNGMKAGWEDSWCAALLLLSGSLDREGGAYQVDSLIYWGQLKPDGMQEYIKARMPITPQGQLTANDTHSLITMFTLAMDAKRRQAHSSVVLKLFQLARNKAADLENRGELTGRLVQIRDYIDAQISSDAQK
jgi:hypothetical protein